MKLTYLKFLFECCIFSQYTESILDVISLHGCGVDYRPKFWTSLLHSRLQLHSQLILKCGPGDKRAVNMTLKHYILLSSHNILIIYVGVQKE
jgi:hypothetical protein